MRQEARWQAWPVMGPARLLVGVLAIALVITAVGRTASSTVVSPRMALAFGALIAFGELARMRMPGNRESAPIATAAALGYTLLLNIAGTQAGHGALQVVFVAAVGMLAGTLPHLAVGRSVQLDVLARRMLVIGIVAFSYRPVAADLPLSGAWSAQLAVMAGAVLLTIMLDALIAAWLRAQALSARYWVTLADEFRAQLRLDLAVGATGILLAFATQDMGVIALLVFTAPLLVTQVAFRRYAGIQTTNLQMVRALSRITEVGGYVEGGHSHRVSVLAVRVGRDLGLSESDVTELEYASLMHDIGQLSLSEPIPGGATVAVQSQAQRRIAELGAQVVTQTGLPDHIAEVVRRQAEPYLAQPDLPIASRIIRVVNAYDDLVGASTDRDRSSAALDRLRFDPGGEYDPAVVESLAAVLDRRLARGWR